MKRRATNRLAKMRAKDVINYTLIVSYFALHTAGYIVFDIWLWDLFHEFHHRHRGGDTRYGIAAFSFFLLWAIFYSGCFLATVFPPRSKPSPGEKIMVHASFGDVVVRIVLIIRFSTWLSHFKIREETENVRYCTACLFALAWGLSEHTLFYCLDRQWWVGRARDIREKWRKEGNERNVERIQISGIPELVERMAELVERMERANKGERVERAEMVGRAERIERDEEAQ